MRGRHNGNRARIDVMRNRGLSVRQIAEQLGISTNTVHVHLHHIRKRLSASPVPVSASGGGYQATKPPLD
jgi:IS30 family transposase